MKKLLKGKLYYGLDFLFLVVVGVINNERYVLNYSRIGLGFRGIIKFDVVSYGGELLFGDNGEMIMKGVKLFFRNGNIVLLFGISFVIVRILLFVIIIY